VVSPLTGRALAEAAMGGAAIVAYDMEWQGELIKTNITGELVPRHDFVAMADSISRYLNDPLYKKRMGTAVREEIIKKMSAVDIAAKTNSIYTKVSG
jgi:glycosyltransferase involved in cell wall biosynthesis